jgi:hypothetical protein
MRFGSIWQGIIPAWSHGEKHLAHHGRGLLSWCGVLGPAVALCSSAPLSWDSSKSCSRPPAAEFCAFNPFRLVGEDHAVNADWSLDAPDPWPFLLGPTMIKSSRIGGEKSGHGEYQAHGLPPHVIEASSISVVRPSAACRCDRPRRRRECQYDHIPGHQSSGFLRKSPYWSSVVFRDTVQSMASTTLCSLGSFFCVHCTLMVHRLPHPPRAREKLAGPPRPSSVLHIRMGRT